MAGGAFCRPVEEPAGKRALGDVAGADADAQELAEKLPSSASRDYGRPFAEVFAEAHELGMHARDRRVIDDDIVLAAATDLVIGH